MNVFRFLWRVYAAPPKSTSASVLRIVIAVRLAMILLRFALTGLVDVSSLPPLHRLIDAWWAYFVLLYVRQRDEARAENKALKEKVSTYEITFRGMPLVAQEMNRRRAEKRGN
ncbi:hypothetical protein [Nonomuraea sp. NPDC050643]|uniref:hypothetical protein n=1 Tax=Nonomuraea sp. NPDC050643 TaxID=3155660 RepID=UPI0033E0465A